MILILPKVSTISREQISKIIIITKAMPAKPSTPARMAKRKNVRLQDNMANSFGLGGRICR